MSLQEIIRLENRLAKAEDALMQILYLLQTGEASPLVHFEDVWPVEGRWSECELSGLRVPNDALRGIKCAGVTYFVHPGVLQYIDDHKSAWGGVESVDVPTERDLEALAEDIERGALADYLVPPKNIRIRNRQKLMPPINMRSGDVPALTRPALLALASRLPLAERLIEAGQPTDFRKWPNWKLRLHLMTLLGKDRLPTPTEHERAEAKAEKEAPEQTRLPLEDDDSPAAKPSRGKRSSKKKAAKKKSTKKATKKKAAKKTTKKTTKKAGKKAGKKQPTRRGKK